MISSNAFSVKTLRVSELAVNVPIERSVDTCKFCLQVTYTTSLRFVLGRRLSIRYKASSRVSLMSRLSRAFVMIRTFWILDWTRARPEASYKRGHAVHSTCTIPSCLLISRTPTAVSASCFVKLPTNSSSSTSLSRLDIRSGPGLLDAEAPLDMCNFAEAEC